MHEVRLHPRVEALIMFAARTLVLSTSAGQVKVPVTIDAPVQERESWACAIEIGWPAKPFRQVARGMDGMQALSNALALVGAYLYGSAEHRSGRLSWAREGGYGFPVPRTMRGELVGFDKEFYG
jgi:hypothetical protein